MKKIIRVGKRVRGIWDSGELMRRLAAKAYADDNS